MWLHHCIRDRSWFYLGAGEECNWCGKLESDPNEVDRIGAFSTAVSRPFAKTAPRT
jgi:hypothetical protein